MIYLNKIWQKTLLYKVLSSDPIFGRVLSILFVIYLFIHIFRLEMYPMYMFAMFSKQETPRELYHVYNLYENDSRIDLGNWDYRKYTVLMNTISQYDDLLNNDMNHPEAEAIDKFVNRLHLEGTSLKSQLKSSFIFSKEELDEKLGIWIGNSLQIPPQNLKIEKASYEWNDSEPSLKRKAIIYGMHE